MSGVSEISSDKGLLGVRGVYKIIEPLNPAERLLLVSVGLP